MTVEYHWLASYEQTRVMALVADLVRRQVARHRHSRQYGSRARDESGNGNYSDHLWRRRRPGPRLAASLARPDGNATGINFFAQEVVAKRLRLLHDLVPKAVRIAALVDPANKLVTASTLLGVQEAAPAIGLQIQTLNASTIGEINAAFAALVRDRPDALFVGAKRTSQCAQPMSAFGSKAEIAQTNPTINRVSFPRV